jgi:hypothetical protein
VIANGGGGSGGGCLIENVPMYIISLSMVVAVVE